MMKVIVTGASGFIGKSLIKELYKHDIEVIAIVRNRNKIPELGDSIKIIEMDLSHPTSEFFDIIEPSVSLVHLAWNGLKNYESIEHIEKELPMHYNFLKSIIRLGVKNIVVTGTCFEYGLQSGKLSEEFDTKPNNPYAFAKDTLRKKLQFLQSGSDFNLTWIRPFYIYGDEQPDNALYSQLRLAVQRGDLLFNMSGGEQLRDYLAVEKVAEYIVKISLQNEVNGIINCCSGKPVSIKSLVESYLKSREYNLKLNLGYYGYNQHEPMEFWGDAEKLHKVIRSELPSKFHK